MLCDLTVAAEHATVAQAGPRVGSFDAGFGPAYLARVVGEKRARQIWFLLDRYDAATAGRWGPVNEVVPADWLLETAGCWRRRDMGGERIATYSPTALKLLKHSFNARTSPSTGWRSTHGPEAQEGLARSPRSALRISHPSVDTFG